MAKFYTAVVTIFNKDGSLDYNGNKSVYENLIRNHSDGIVLMGSTGEFFNLTLTQAKDLAANRGENITVIFVNNGIYGMTGGQLAPTTLVGMKASTAPKGRNPKEHGYPMHMCEILNELTAPRYLVRTSCNNPGNVMKTKDAIKKAFQNQLEGKGFSMVEIVTGCPTNWGMTALESLDFIEDHMLKEFPLGVIRDK